MGQGLCSLEYELVHLERALYGIGELRTVYLYFLSDVQRLNAFGIRGLRPHGPLPNGPTPGPRPLGAKPLDPIIGSRFTLVFSPPQLNKLK